MALNPETANLIKRLDDATNAAAAKLRAALDDAASDTLTPETRAAIEAVAVRLETLGANPADPIPPAPPEPTPTPA